MAAAAASAGAVAAPATLTASAPGKVLLCGGYLVLQATCTGAVAAVSARFHTTVAPAAPAPAAPARGVPLHLYSPQFRAAWHFSLVVDGATQRAVAVPAPPPDAAPAAAPNAYAEAAVNCALLAIAAHPAGLAHLTALTAATPHGFDVTLRADNDFYSQRAQCVARGWPVTVDALRRLPPHLPFMVDDATGKVIVNKTGLGSSAALTTSLVAAVLAYFGGLHRTLPDARFRDVAHTVAQIAHGLAQGKVRTHAAAHTVAAHAHMHTHARTHAAAGGADWLWL